MQHPLEHLFHSRFERASEEHIPDTSNLLKEVVDHRVERKVHLSEQQQLNDALIGKGTLGHLQLFDGSTAKTRAGDKSVVGEHSPVQKDAPRVAGDKNSSLQKDGRKK